MRKQVEKLIQDYGMQRLLGVLIELVGKKDAEYAKIFKDDLNKAFDKYMKANNEKRH